MIRFDTRDDTVIQFLLYSSKRFTGSSSSSKIPESGLLAGNTTAHCTSKELGRRRESRIRKRAGKSCDWIIPGKDAWVSVPGVCECYAAQTEFS